MSPETNFILSLVATVALLVAVVATGLKARRRQHLILVACALIGLLTTIYFAEKLGEHYNLDSAGRITPVHLMLAKIATYSFVLPLVTGLITLRKPRWRRRHRWCALLTLTLTLAAAGTGYAMVQMATPL